MKRMIFSLLLILAFATHGLTANLKIGHFDLQKVVSQSLAGKEARELYLQKAKIYQDEINQRTEKLNTLKEEIKGQAEKLKDGDTPSASLIAKDKSAAGQFRELQRLLEGYQEELKRYDADLSRNVLVQLQPVLAKYAEKNKYDYLFKIAEPLVYATNKRDVTDELIKMFDKQSKK